MALGEWHEAASILLALRREEPHDERNLWRLGLVREKMGLTGGALYERALERDAHNGQAALGLSRCLSLGQPRAASDTLCLAKSLSASDRKLEAEFRAGGGECAGASVTP